LIEIDGSYGEGGGQLVRMALAFSSIFAEPIRIFNIRARRSNPGIRPQHLAAIRSVIMISGGKVDGAHVGSSILGYFPERPVGGKFSLDIGTAGSVAMVLQALLPISLMAEKEVTGIIRGGTEVPWSPTVDYFDEVFLKAVRRMGAQIRLKLLRSGYYPKGGGLVEFKVEPSKELGGLDLIDFPKRTWVKGISRSHNLPQSVSERQSNAARKYLESRGIEVEAIQTLSGKEALGPGSSITLWASGTSELYVGGDALGERGKPSEKVGEESAGMIWRYLESKAPVDEHVADMLLPYLVLAKGQSRMRISNPTQHLLTEIHVANLFGKTNVSLTEDETPTLIVSA